MPAKGSHLNVPAVLVGLVGFLKPLLADGALPSWYKELIATLKAGE